MADAIRPIHAIFAAGDDAYFYVTQKPHDKEIEGSAYLFQVIGSLSVRPEFVTIGQRRSISSTLPAFPTESLKSEGGYSDRRCFCATPLLRLPDNLSEGTVQVSLPQRLCPSFQGRCSRVHYFAVLAVAKTGSETGRSEEKLSDEEDWQRSVRIIAKAPFQVRTGTWTKGGHSEPLLYTLLSPFRLDKATLLDDAILYHNDLRRRTNTESSESEMDGADLTHLSLKDVSHREHWSANVGQSSTEVRDGESSANTANRGSVLLNILQTLGEDELRELALEELDSRESLWEQETNMGDVASHDQTGRVRLCADDFSLEDRDESSEERGLLRDSLSRLSSPPKPPSPRRMREFNIMVDSNELLVKVQVSARSVRPGDDVFFTLIFAGVQWRCVSVFASLEVKEELHRDFRRSLKAGSFSKAFVEGTVFCRSMAAAESSLALPLDAPPSFETEVFSITWSLRIDVLAQKGPGADSQVHSIIRKLNTVRRPSDSSADNRCCTIATKRIDIL